ncbi:MAG TPA: hypothetical protein VGO57_02840 [Verrucomicrobiae bacterium]
MKLSQTILGAPLLSLALFFAGNASSVAQSSVPSDTDYSRFSQFIADRNIFDPSRYPHGGHSTYVRPRSRSRNNSAPAFALVGTMAYEKGIFAFFSGNNEELTKILSVSGNIVGYTVTEITSDSVKLMGADKKEFTLKIGAGMRQGTGGWELADADDLSAGSGIGNISAIPATGGGNNSTPATTSGSPPPSASLDQNDVLKRLKQQREQENK